MNIIFLMFSLEAELDSTRLFQRHPSVGDDCNNRDAIRHLHSLKGDEGGGYSGESPGPFRL